jgi:hypothetical protein
MFLASTLFEGYADHPFLATVFSSHLVEILFGAASPEKNAVLEKKPNAQRMLRVEPRAGVSMEELDYASPQRCSKPNV